jgi:phage gpG-like protein
MIEGLVLGGTEVVQRFDAMPKRLREELRVGIERLSIRLTNKVKDKLNGQVLKVRTGLLRRSITQAVMEQGDTVTGITSTAVAYARAHEYGFDGVVSVRAHMRTIKQAFGRSINPVAAHSMHMKLPEKSFLRSSLRELEASGAIRDGLAEAVRKATI